MKFSARELVLAWMTAVVVLCGVTYVVCKPHIESAKARHEQILELKHRIAKSEGLVVKQAGWEARLAELRRIVGPLSTDRPPVNYLKRTVGELANKNKVRLRNLNAGREETQAGLHVLPISCPYEECRTEGIVNLLLDFGTHDVMFDVSELSIRSSGNDDLRGSFTVNCAYTE